MAVHTPMLYHPQHILEKHSKKDYQIFDASQKYDWDSIPINLMTSTPLGSDLQCEFGKLCEDILLWAYNLQILCPHGDIVIHTNDIKSCF